MLRAFLTHFNFLSLYMCTRAVGAGPDKVRLVLLLLMNMRESKLIIAVILLIPSVLPVYRHSSAMGKLSRYYIPVY